MTKTALALMLGTALMAPGLALAQDDPVKRGEYLVTFGGCHDCHTPLMMGPNGPEPDMTRALSGHPQDFPVSGQAKVDEPWLIVTTPTLTAWSGPWGVSFTANLTPDPETGILRDFTEEQFIQTLRTGRHQGQGRQILPRLPTAGTGHRSASVMKAILADERQVKDHQKQVA